MRPSEIRRSAHACRSCVVLVAALGAARLGSAQVGPAGANTAGELMPTDAEPASRPSDEEAAPEDPGPSAEVELEPDEDSIVPPSPARAGPALDHVQAELKRVEAEQASASNLWPWLSVGVGLGATVGSSAYGFIYAIDCDGDCSTPNWVSFVVVAGAAVAALSMIWLVRTDNDIRALDSQHYRLERDLERLQLSSRTGVRRVRGGLVTVHF